MKVRVPSIPAAMAPCEVHIPISATPGFLAQVRLLAASLRRWGGAFADARIVVTVSRDQEAFDVAATHPWSEALGIEWRWMDEALFDQTGIFGTALQRFRYDFEAPYVLMLDADTVCNAPLDDLPASVGRGLGGCIAHVSPNFKGDLKFPEAAPPDERFWDALFTSAELAAPVLEHEHPGWGYMDHAEARRHCPAYFNLGVLFARADVMRELGSVIFDELANVNRFVHTFFRCQLAVTLALARAEIPGTVLPMRWNFPNDEGFARMLPGEAGAARILHYLRQDEIDRYSIAIDQAAIDAFLARDDLHRMNRVLQARVRDLAEDLRSGQPSLRDRLRRRPEFPFARPSLPAIERFTPYLRDSYETRWFANGGPALVDFERRLAEQGPRGRDVVAVPSATAGLVAALLAAGARGPVVLPAFTFPATPHAVELAGCEPLFVDVDPTLWEMTPAAVAAALAREACGAVVHVRPFGLCRDLAGIEAVCREARVPLIVDSAAAFGGARDHQPVGRSGVAEIFSFHATKPFAIGEGGAVFANPEMAARVRRVANFAIDDSDVVARGLNAKLSDVSSAVGLAMLDEFDDRLERRRTAARALCDVVARHPDAQLARDVGQPPWQSVPMLLRSSDIRARVDVGLKERGIEARRYYSPLHRTTAFARYARDDLPVTNTISDRMLCLPVYDNFTSMELERIVSHLDHALRAARPSRAPVA
ncbi:MAG: hypothetical protein QOJ29_3841 [Thermoleophilaceae bacterium]|nr:hypothetical protein [Thermoleophilaceae bacterium]